MVTDFLKEVYFILSYLNFYSKLREYCALKVHTNLSVIIYWIYWFVFLFIYVSGSFFIYLYLSFCWYVCVCLYVTILLSVVLSVNLYVSFYTLYVFIPNNISICLTHIQYSQNITE